MHHKCVNLNKSLQLLIIPVNVAVFQIKGNENLDLGMKIN